MSLPAPTLKTYEEFCAFYEKDNPENKRWLYKQYEFAVKERERLRQKDKARRLRLKAQIPEGERKRPGRPRKSPLPVNPSPGSDISPK